MSYPILIQNNLKVIPLIFFCQQPVAKERSVSKKIVQDTYQDTYDFYLEGITNLTNRNSIFSPKKHEVKNIVEKLENLTNIEDILVFSKETFVGKKQPLVNRLIKLLDLHDADDSEISIESLKSMLAFLIAIAINFKIPSMTLNENGIFHLNWRKDNFNLITLRFKKESSLDYVIFRPSQHIKKPIILKGCMNLFDFTQYLKRLNLHLLEN